MGINNRQRRASKMRKRPRPQRPRPAAEPGDSGFRSHPDPSAAKPLNEVAEVARGLEQQVARAWDRGWQPADVCRLVDREAGRAEAEMVRWVIASEADSYASLGARVAPGWMAQLESVDATRTWDPTLPYLLQLSSAWHETSLVAARLARVLSILLPLPRLCDPPSTWRDGAAVPSGSLPDGLLHRVRALLAKAEATEFEAEADAFTAKAQELIARHRIDQAVLGATSGDRGDAPVGRRITVDDPYADAKTMLLMAIAKANGCESVWSKGLGFVTVFGFADELDAVDELFTSLLVQATGALRREGPKHDHYGRSRTRRFRRSFLLAFAARIGQRLRETVDATVAAATIETGTSLVPILMARSDESKAIAESAFPDATPFAPRPSDVEGWHAGTAFANVADITARRPPISPA